MGPTALILSRQNLPTLSQTKVAYEEGVGRGAYIVLSETPGVPLDYTLFATGSELHLALNVAKELMYLDKNIRVVSFPCWELFEKQDAEYRSSVIGGDLGFAYL